MDVAIERYRQPCEGTFYGWKNRHLSVVRPWRSAEGGGILRGHVSRQPCWANHSPSDYPGGKQGNELTVEFTVLGQDFVGLNGGPAFTPNEAVSFQVMTDDQAETDRYWRAIIENGGCESECGWCKDRWGFSWQIVPRALIAALNDPDRAAAKRAMEAMMTMRRIDIATIETARAGQAAT